MKYPERQVTSNLLLRMMKVISQSRNYLGKKLKVHHKGEPVLNELGVELHSEIDLDREKRLLMCKTKPRE